MLEFKIPRSIRSDAERWCLTYIGPRRYYLHNAIGGEGWKISQQNVDTMLSINDDKKALMAMLTLSGKDGR